MARGKKVEIPVDKDGDTAVIDDKNDPKVEVVAEPEAQAANIEPESANSGVAELKRRLLQAEEAQAKAERERNEAVQRAYQAKNETEDTNLRLIESAIGQVQANSSILEENYAAAVAQGDHRAAAKIAREMAANEAKILQLENGKQSLKERPKQPERPLDPVEAFAQTRRPREAAWIRAHPQYILDPKLSKKLEAAHNLALADDIEMGSDDYFHAVEETLGLRGNRAARIVQTPDDDEVDDPLSEAGRGSGGRQIAPSAIPVSRNISPSGAPTRTVRLSAQEIEIAAMTGQTPEEYAKQKQRIARESMN